MAGRRRDELQAVHREQPDHRVFGFGNRRRVVGERHHLAFVLELPHVEQVGDVLEEDTRRVTGGRRGDAREPAVGEGADGRGEAVADAVDGDDGAGGKAARVSRRHGVAGVMIEEPHRRAGDPGLAQRTARKRGADRPRRCRRRPLGDAILRALSQRGPAAGRRLAPADAVVRLLRRRKYAGQGLRDVGRAAGRDVDVARSDAGHLAAGADGCARKRDLELAPREALLVDRGDQRPVDDERGAGVVAVPESENVHGWLPGARTGRAGTARPRRRVTSGAEPARRQWPPARGPKGRRDAAAGCRRSGASRARARCATCRAGACVRARALPPSGSRGAAS